MKDLIKFLESRHSVREYVTKPVELEKQNIIKNLVNEINQKRGTQFEVFFNRPDAFKGIILKHWMKDCEHIIVFYDNDAYRAGYYSAEIMLKIQELGLNSCYVGASYKKHLFEVKDKQIQCALAFGYGANSGKPHKNKKLDKIIDFTGDKPDNFDEIIRVLLSAPSALNLQRFKIIKDDKNEIKIVKSANGAFSDFDFGILNYYLDLTKKEVK